jgi:predicted nucleic acid-binding protein
VYLLDTSIVSELRKPRPHGAVLAWMESVALVPLYISAVTIGEIQMGIERTREQDPEKADAIEAWLQNVIASYDVLAMNGASFRRWAKLLHKQSSTRMADAMIAATAFTHNLTVATRNVGDFKHFNCPVVDPFDHKNSS